MTGKEKFLISLAIAAGSTVLFDLATGAPAAEPMEAVAAAATGTERTPVTKTPAPTETLIPKPSETPIKKAAATATATATAFPTGKGGGNPIAGLTEAAKALQKAIDRAQATITKTPDKMVNAKNSGPEKGALIISKDKQVYSLEDGETGWFQAGKQPKQKVDVAVSFVQAKAKGPEDIIVGYFSNEQGGKINVAWHESSYKGLLANFLGQLTPTDSATTNSSVGFIDRYLVNGGSGSTEWYGVAVINKTGGPITFTIQSKDKPPTCEGKESFSFTEHLPNQLPGETVNWGSCDKNLKPKSLTFAYPDGQKHQEAMADLRKQQIRASRRQTVRIT